MHGELLIHSFVEPGIVFVASADATPTTGGDDSVCHEALHAPELLFLLWVSHFDAEGGGVRVPHGQVCTGGKPDSDT